MAGDEFGHVGKDCPKPRDGEFCYLCSGWSYANYLTVTRVVCSNCQTKGHWKSKCPNPPAEENGGDSGFGNGSFDNGGIDNGGFDNAGASGGDADGWASTPVEASGGGGGGW